MSNNAPVQFLVAFLDTRRKKTEEVTGEEVGSIENFDS